MNGRVLDDDPRWAGADAVPGATGWGHPLPPPAAAPGPPVRDDHERLLVTSLLTGFGVWVFLLLVRLFGPWVSDESADGIEEALLALVAVFFVFPIMIMVVVSLMGATLAMLPPLVRWVRDRERPWVPGLFLAHAVLAWSVAAYLLLATPYAGGFS